MSAGNGHAAMTSHDESRIRETTRGELLARIKQLENTLKWIRFNAGLHYIGQAFDPEHMRFLANMAAEGIYGDKLPDFDLAVADAAAYADNQLWYLDDRKPDEDDKGSDNSK